MITLAIVSDVRLYRDGLAQMIGADSQFQVVRTLDSSSDVCDSVSTLTPDLALVDLALPGGLELVRELVRRAPNVKILALGVTEADAIELTEAGIAGFVTRDVSLDDLIHALASAARGEALCSPRMVALLMQRVAALAGDRRPAPSAVLTSREREILVLVDCGCSNKEIARRLQIQATTVKNHVHNILEKLNVSRRAEAAALMRGVHLD